MDTSLLNEALASNSYDKIADICDNLMLQGAAKGIEFQDEWPYAIHLLGHIYNNDINSARFLWKRVPAAIKEAWPEVVAVWRIGQKLWTRDYVGVHEAVCGFSWSPEVQPIVASFAELYKKRMLELLLSAYSTISTQDSAHFLGMNENDATNFVPLSTSPHLSGSFSPSPLVPLLGLTYTSDVLQQGWVLDSASQMLTVKKQAVITEQKLDPSKLQRLTEYVFHLEH